MNTETMFGQVQPPAAERARRWAALPATVREKYERLEAEARQLEGGSTAAREALEAARRAKRQADERLRAATDPYLLPKNRPAAAAIAVVVDELRRQRLESLEREAAHVSD